MDLNPAILTPIAIAGVFALVARSIKTEPTPDAAGQRTLALGRVMAVLAWVCIAIFVLPIIGLSFSDERGDLGTWGLLLLVCGPFGAVGYYLLRYVRYHRVSYDDHGLTVTDQDGNSKSITWTEVTSLNYNPNWGFLYVYTPQGRLKISNALQGFEPFHRVLEQRTGFNTSGFHSPYG